MLNVDTFLIFILLIHFLADFGLQTHEQAVGKATSKLWLTKHVGAYSLIWFVAAFVILNSVHLAFIYALITFILHWCTDYITSKESRKFFDRDDFHNGFVVIGFDQFLHIIQLWFTFKLIPLL